ncbi:MAG: hypothetical protein AB1726_18455, partial [Planctomycetota bacterium]
MPRLPRSPPILLLVGGVLLAWGPTLLSRGFSYDDAELIVGNPLVEGSLPAGEAFGRDYWHHRGVSGHYRPLSTLSLRLDRALWGERVAGYHATNLALFLLLVLLAARLLARAGALRGAPLAGLALFAVHPAL